jgi:hypothetical protein
MIRMSGAGRKPKGKKLNFIQNEKIKTGRYIPPEVLEMMKNSKGKKELKELFGAGMDSDDEDMDCAGFFDEVKKGYSKAKKGVKSKTGQKIKGALMEDKSFMKEFTKAKKQLMDYQNGVRKTKPGKAAMAILEKSGVISKIEDEFKGAGNKSGKISRIKKAKKWRDFSNNSLRMGIDTGRYGYEQFKEATNPIQTEGKKVIKSLGKMFGGAQGGTKRGPSMWIAHVKKFSEANNIPYKEALKAAGPSYRAIKNKM